ncbi:MAG: pyridoxal phosphate-dependent aminotransferase [Coriobacteriia bacterium]|nr:pyridoxal phosphate-dependent aminotransferase [Coriobacteriia bacterium]
MLTERYIKLGSEPNAIRSLFAYGQKRKAEIGEDKVYDFSIGNPSVPAPEKVKETISKLLEEPADQLHSYSQSAGLTSTRQAMANNLRQRFGIDAKYEHVYMTHGAAAGLAITIGAVAAEGDEVVVITPYFCEYSVWIETARATVVEVPAREADFQLDVPAMAAAINARTAAVIIDSPNNPVGSVYSAQNIREFTDMLKAKEAEVGHPIYLISDEPYREITYGDEVPFVPDYYDNTILCYSFSKSLSLPGERIGYIYVSDRMPDVDNVWFSVCGAARAMGYICASVLFQRVVEECVNEPSDVEAYRQNRELFTSMLDELGYEYIQPQGAFYLWIKALEEDDMAFSERAKSQFDLLLCPSSCFHGKGWARAGYCISPETIKNSRVAWEGLKASYQD